MAEGNGTGAIAPVRLELGCTHREFHRSLEHALAGWRRQGAGATIRAERDGASVRIEVGPERRRRIALLELPVIDVEIQFTGFATGDAARFMEHFRRAFQRGGG